MKKKIVNTVLVLLGGIILGIFSKWLDSLEINSNIWWQSIIERLDLNNFFSNMAIWIFLVISISVFSKTSLRAVINVFCFLIGMNISYHLYTIYVCGFNPKNYMITWYTITLLSPIFSYVCWYAKSNKKISSLITGLVLIPVCESCFNIGMWYFDTNGILYTLTFIGTCIVLYKKPIDLTVGLVIGLIISCIITIPYISG